MTLAWFRLADPHSPRHEDTSTLLAELAATHQLDVFDAVSAHDFPWRHDRRPYDVCVYELADRRSHALLAGYALHYPGIVLLRSKVPADDRLAASRLIVVHDEAIAQRLADRWPKARIRVAPAGVANVADRDPAEAAAGITVAVLDDSRITVVDGAVARARAAGTDIRLVRDGSVAERVEQADVVIALDWSGGPPIAALLGMAAGKAVVVLETEATAGWPALDPQTWQPRHLGDAAAVVVAIDLRDEEHSLLLAMRRLAADPAFRDRLGAAAQRWWREHATVPHAVRAWTAILEEAASLTPAAQPPREDGSRFAREVLQEFGLTVDIID